MKSVISKNHLAALTLISVVIFFWWLTSFMQWVPVYIMPSPTQVIATLVEMRVDFYTATISTLTSALIGFLASAILGYALAVVFSFFSILRSAVLPLAVFFQTVPIIAIAPLLVIWFGFGERTVQVSSFVVSFFPVLASSLIGLASEDVQLLEMLNIHNASKTQTFWYLKIPSSWPFVFSGLRVSSGLAVIGAIVGEFVAGGGLGGLIDSGRSQQRVDIVFASIFLCSALGYALLLAVRLTSRIMQLNRPYFKSETLGI